MNYFSFPRHCTPLKGSVGVLDGRLFVKIRFNVRSFASGVIVPVDEWRAAPDQTVLEAFAAFGVSASTDLTLFKHDVDEVILKGTASFTVATQTGFFGQSFVLPNLHVYGEKNIYICFSRECRITLMA